jgi:hypothetical protein
VYTDTRGGWMYPAWMRSCILGSVFAFSISALVSVLISIYLAPYRSGIHNTVRIQLVATAAILEGALIGYFQWLVLRRLFPTMTSTSWIGATMIASGSGYLLSWLPTSYALTADLASRIRDMTQSPSAIARISLVTGALVGLIWGITQFAVLRLHVHRAGSWIVASTISWAISFVWLYLAAFLPDRTTNPVVQIAVAPLAGLVHGWFLGMLQGRVLVRLHSRLLVPSLPGKGEAEGKRRFA